MAKEKKKVDNAEELDTTKKTTKKTEKKETKKSASTTKKASTSTKTKSSTKAKTTAAKTKTTSTKAKTEKKVETPKKVEKKETPKTEEIKPKESAIISKIKEFLKKIVKMQEDDKKEKIKEKEKETKKAQIIEEKEIEKEKDNTYNLEYYDLPYRYNETVVKILAQTPKRLFVYWDISDSDKEKYINFFGRDFFEQTYPVLLIHNEDKNYTFEVPINDFANSWYLDINDPKSKYTIQLGRRFRDRERASQINLDGNKDNIVIQNGYMPITTSNTLEVPNDHILFGNLQPYIIYRNVKTYEENAIEISNLEFARKMGKVYNIYDIYKKIYKNEMEDNSLLDLLNPSSMGLSSSSFTKR